MAKSSKKTKRVMTCSKCGAEGFNARKCPTKDYPWTALSLEEVSQITSVLGIDKTEISEAQIAYAISRRKEGDNVEPLAWFYHSNLELLNAQNPVVPTPISQNTDTQEAVASKVVEAMGDEESEEETSSEEESSSEEMLVLSVSEDELAEIKSDFDSEIWYLLVNDAMKNNDEQLCPTSAVGNSTVEAWTEAETGYLTISVMLQVNGKLVNNSVEYTEDIPSGEELAKDWLELSLVEIEQGRAEIVAQAKAKAEAEAKAKAKAEEQAKNTNKEHRDEVGAKQAQAVLTDDTSLVGFEPTETGYKLLFNGPDGFIQGEKDMGFSLAAQLGFDDVERLVMSVAGELRLCVVPTDQIVLLENMKPNAIPFSLWETLDFDPSDSEYWLTSKLDESETPIVLGVRKAPTGKTWVVKAVCVA